MLHFAQNNKNTTSVSFVLNIIYSDRRWEQYYLVGWDSVVLTVRHIICLLFAVSHKGINMRTIQISHLFKSIISN